MHTHTHCSRFSQTSCWLPACRVQSWAPSGQHWSLELKTWWLPHSTHTSKHGLHTFQPNCGINTPQCGNLCVCVFVCAFMRRRNKERKNKYMCWSVEVCLFECLLANILCASKVNVCVCALVNSPSLWSGKHKLCLIKKQASLHFESS